MRTHKRTLFVVAAIALSTTAVIAQPRQPQPFLAGQPVGIVDDGVLTPLAPNARVFGSFVSAHSCAYDPDKGLIIVPSRGVSQGFIQNDAHISLINHDGSVHTLKWIGVNRNRLVLNQPTGTGVGNGLLYVADIDGGTRDPAGGVNLPSVAVVRMFDLQTGEPVGSVAVPESTGFIDLAVSNDGLVYALQRGPRGAYPPAESMRVYLIAPDGTSSVVVEGPPMRLPAGIAIDADGNIVVVNNGNDDVLTFSPDGELLLSEKAPTEGNSGIVVTPDGTKYVGSETTGVVSRIRPGMEAEVIAEGIPEPTSMCFDADANQLVMPLGAGNAITLLTLD